MTNSSCVKGRCRSDAGSATVASPSVTTVEDPNAGVVQRGLSGNRDNLATKDSSVSELREAVAAAAWATRAAAKASSVAAALGLHGWF